MHADAHEQQVFDQLLREGNVVIQQQEDIINPPVGNLVQELLIVGVENRYARIRQVGEIGMILQQNAFQLIIHIIPGFPDALHDLPNQGTSGDNHHFPNIPIPF